MKMIFTALSIAAAALVPATALAQTSCEQQRSTRVVATVGGAGVGALLGSSVAGRGDRTLGAIIGGLGGALLGNRIAKPGEECAHAYGYYDRDARWHASANARSNMTGYIDRDGQWVDGAPNGYYGRDGRWQANAGDVGERGYFDASDRWVPAGASGYYGRDGQWLPAMAPGHYQHGGNWVAGRVSGRYDRNGTWIGGSAPSRQQADGSWNNAGTPGHYDADRRWHAGTTNGFYDGNGRWMTTDGGVAVDGATRGEEPRGARPGDIRGQIGWLDRDIRHATDSGSISARESRRLLGELRTIDRQERGMRHVRGTLSPRDAVRIRAGLDRITTHLDARTARRTD